MPSHKSTQFFDLKPGRQSSVKEFFAPAERSGSSRSESLRGTKKRARKLGWNNNSGDAKCLNGSPGFSQLSSIGKPVPGQYENKNNSNRQRVNGFTHKETQQKHRKSARQAENTLNGEQSYLDCGQREFLNRKCSKCDMVYAPGVVVDEREHLAFCARQSIRDSMIVGHRIDRNYILESYNDKSLTLGFRDFMNSKKHGSVLRRILEIKNKTIDPSMGFSSGNINGKSVSLFVRVSSKKKLIGLLCTELIQSNHKIRSSMVDSTGSISDCKEYKKEEPLFGVLQIWIASDERRGGIASGLLDVARRKSTYGYIVPRSRICFSQPTEAGALFAAAYCQDQDRIVSIYELT